MNYMDLLTSLRFNLRELENPYFSEAELNHLLEKNDNNLRKASYEGLLIKAEDDSIALPGGLQVPSNQNYWLNLAKMYRGNFTGVMVRSDEVESKK